MVKGFVNLKSRRFLKITSDITFLSTSNSAFLRTNCYDESTVMWSSLSTALSALKLTSSVHSGKSETIRLNFSHN